MERVRFTNVPSFVFEQGLEVETSRGRVRADISFGGAFYAFVTAESVGLVELTVTKFIALGREIKAAIETARDVVHPLEPELRRHLRRHLRAGSSQHHGLRRRRGRPLAVRERDIGTTALLDRDVTLPAARRSCTRA